MLLNIRPARASDALTTLWHVPPNASAPHLRAEPPEQATPGQTVFVVEAHGMLQGASQIQAVRHIASDGYAEILAMGLANPNDQADMVGAMLDHAGEWALQQGHRRCRVRLDERDASQAGWLQSRSFVRSKAGYLFSRSTIAAPDISTAAIRPARIDDAAAIATLLPDLGYVAEPEQVAMRFARLIEWPGNALFLYERAGQVVGLCQVQGVGAWMAPAFAEVHALVVAKPLQGEGLGKALLAKALHWAAAQGYATLRLGSGVHRVEAHRFYAAQGFTHAGITYAFERAC